MSRKNIQFYGTASTREDAVEKAKELLKQVPSEEGELHYHIEVEGTHSEKGELTFFVVRCKASDFNRHNDDSLIRLYPSALAMKRENTYSIYLCIYDRLPFYFKHSETLDVLLSFWSPIPKPVDNITVEDMNTPEGRRAMDAIFTKGQANTEPSDTSEALQYAEQELKIYALYDNFGELSLEEVIQALETGQYDGGVTDLQEALSEVTGKAYKTEEEYLNALAELCGADAVEQHREKVVHGYRFYKALYFLHYVEYRLRMTEDYSLVEAELPELEERYGMKEEYYKEIGLNREHFLLNVLYHYLQPYVTFTDFFGGMTDTRVAEYLKAPIELIRQLGTDTDKIGHVW